MIILHYLIAIPHHSHKKEAQNSLHLRGGIGSGAMEREPEIVGKDDPNRVTKETDTEDQITRNLYDAVSPFAYFTLL